MIHRKRMFVLLLLSALFFLACNLTVPLTLARVWLVSSADGSAPVELTPTAVPTDVYDPLLSRVIRSEESADSLYSIYLEHPEMNQAGEAGRVFNQMIEQYMLAELGAFRNNVDGLDEASKELGNSFYELNYRTYRSDQKFISLLMVEDIYYAGAAHPGRFYYAVNYDIGREQFLEMTDLFIDQTPFLLVISQYCAQEITTLYPGGYGTDGLASIPENYARWNVTADGLLITFQEYQVAPYAAGSPQVIVPYDLLIDYIDPDGPLGILLPREDLFING